VLYTFALTPATALTQLQTGLTNAFLPRFATANGFCYLADSGKNFVTNGSSSWELQAGDQTGAFTAASGGSAVGNTAETIKYWYTHVHATTGEESPPSAAVSVNRTADQGVNLTNVDLDFTAPYTTINIYRTREGSTQPYRVTTGLTAASFPYADTSLDTALSTVSTVHDSAGTASIEKPAAAKHCAFHKGRMFFANMTSLTSRLRWSKPLEPTQWSNATTALFDIHKDDGDVITGIIPFRGSLVIFKDHSIHVLNGDVDETQFVVYEVVHGIGCVAPRTIVANEQAIYFLSHCGVYRFDLANLVEVSEKIGPDFVGLPYSTYAASFCAGWEPIERQYVLSVTPSGGTSNTVTHVLNVDTGAWGKIEYGMGKIVPSCYANIENSTDELKLYMGDDDGYGYELNTATGADGVTSGTKTGTVTSGGATTLTDSAAAFRTTGDGLTGLPVTKKAVADGAYETQEILSNTANVITVASWTATPAAGDTYWVGAYQGQLALGRSDGGEAGLKRWYDLVAEFEKQTHTVDLEIGYTLDGDTAPTASSMYAMTAGYRARLPINRRAVGCAPFLRIRGTDHDFELIRLELSAEPFPHRMPVRG